MPELMPDYGWPVAWGESERINEASAEQIALAEAFAGQTLRMLTLGRVGGHPITVMPHYGCHHNGSPYLNHLGSGAPFYPYRGADGLIYNHWFRCGCSTLPNAVYLDAPVGRVDAVTIGGVALPTTDYEVWDGNALVRTDSEPWPSQGTGFTVTYLNAFPVDGMGAYVAGILAEEYLKAIIGDKRCRLPAATTTVARQGITIEMTTGMFPNGMTGITEVDTYLRQFNPHGLKVAPTVYSPDLEHHRHRVTWRP